MSFEDWCKNTYGFTSDQLCLLGGKDLKEAYNAGVAARSWQPIETVPKDGTQFMVFGGNSMRIVNWPKGCAMGEWQQINGEWRGAGVRFEHLATHWMPLPDPPR